jgi:hypothetical protein
MTVIFLRLWLVLVTVWVGYNLYIHRDTLNTFRHRDWGKALEFGLNSMACEVKLTEYCRDLQIPFFQKSSVVETWGLIVTFVGWPVVAFFACLVMAWVVHTPAAKQRSVR